MSITEGAASGSDVAVGVLHLMERVPSVSLHTDVKLSETCPGAGLTRYLIPSVCFGHASRVFGQIDAPGSSLEGDGGGEGLQAEFQTEVVGFHTHFLCIHLKKLYLNGFASTALSFETSLCREWKGGCGIVSFGETLQTPSLQSAASQRGVCIFN